MTCWQWNGKSFRRAKALPLGDRGFRYGMALFESVRVWDGAVEFWEAHQLRLLAACAERDFPVAVKVLESAERSFARAKLNGFGRIYVTAGDGGPAAPVTGPR